MRARSFRHYTEEIPSKYRLYVTSATGTYLEKRSMANALTSAMDAWLEHAAGIIYQNEAEIIRIHVIPYMIYYR